MQGVCADPGPDPPQICTQTPCLEQRAAAATGHCREWVAENPSRAGGGTPCEPRKAPSPQHMLHCPRRLHTTHKFKDKPIKNFQTAGSHRVFHPPPPPIQGALLGMGLCWTALVRCQGSWSWLRTSVWDGGSKSLGTQNSP